MADLTRYGIGVDPSMTATGLALISWHPVSGTRILATATVEPLEADDFIEAANGFQDIIETIRHNIDCLTIEAGFVVPGRRHSGIMISRAGGICAGLLYERISFPVPLCNIVWLMATQWRPIVWPGEGANNWSTKTAKAQARLWVSALDGYDAGMSEHACEAVAIAAAGMQYQSDKERTT